MYIIKNLNSFAKAIGKMVAKNGGFTQRELKSYIKVKNIKKIIKKHTKFSNEGFILIDEETTNIICNEIFDWLVGVDLAKLAAEDILDCYWDNDQNCMIFKHKDKNNI